jgi:ABC-2 type transport system ATP-binding protein
MTKVFEHSGRPRLDSGGSLQRQTGDWAVEVHGLTKRFGARTAVDSVDLLVPQGSAFGYLGPNGAGKTTLIRVLLGLTKADSGTMSLLGLPVPDQRSLALARVGAIVDEPRFHSHLTGRENLKALAAARGGEANKQIDPALERTRLTERADDNVSAYSMGMRQRLGLAACLLADPQLLILDEPMNGLDPAGIHEMRELLHDLTGEGRTVMLSSHLLDEVERTCDQVAIVDHGKVIRQGPIGELAESAGVAVEVQCSDPAAAERILSQPATGSRIALTEDGLGLTVTLAAGGAAARPAREHAAEINRLLVGAGISVYDLRQTRARLEDWFLSVTSRLGDEQ